MLKKINNQHCLTALTARAGEVVPKGLQLGVNSLIAEVLAVRRSGR